MASLLLVILYMAKMSAAGPWDPWETHYGEVARQILVRSDPVDLWWSAGNGGPHGAAEKSFASKPALPFWLMALSMKVLGVGTGADPTEMVQPLWPELAIRLPSMLAGLLTCAFAGAVVWRLASPRAGVITGLVLGTMPQFAIVSRQALTDMFVVGPVVLACGAWAMAWLQPDRELRTRGQGLRQIPWDRAYLAFFAFFLISAIVPLAVIHQHSFSPLAWEMFGRVPSKAKGLKDIQQHMFVYWAIAAVVLVASLRWRRRSQAWMGILYLAAGLSLLGKGLIGPGVVGVVVLAHLAVSGRWGLLRRCGLPTGILMFALSSFPWHHAMILYRGDRWVNELIIQNNLQRFSSGEQKQAVGSFAYYLETLGLAALPWSAVVPMALWRGFRAFTADAPTEGEGEPESADHGAAALMRFAVLWFCMALLVISFSTTKYYHYLLPVLPPLAIVIGLWLDRAWQGGRARSLGIVVGALVGVAVLIAVVRDAMLTPAWLAHLTTYLYTGMWTKGAPDTTRLAITCLPFAVGLGLWAMARRRWAVGAFLFSALLTTGYVIADYIPAASESWSQRTMLRTYFDQRDEQDRLVSWWFYYRGETFFSKGDIWVMRENDRGKLAELFTEQEQKGGALWLATIESHAKRLKSSVPAAYRDDIQEVYRSYHYVMMRVPTKSGDRPAE